MLETLVTSVTSFSITRSFDAPREKVFDAWTQPASLKVWFGPPGFPATVAGSPGGAGAAGPTGESNQVLQCLHLIASAWISSAQ